MRVVLLKSNGRIIESQSGSGGLEALINNAIAAGLSAEDFEAKEMPDAEFHQLLAAQIESERTYADKRRSAYPSISDQMDMIWHTINAGQALDKDSEFFKAIAAVKARFPK